MCGRYSNQTTWAEVQAFSAPLPVLTPDSAAEQVRIAPTDSAWVLAHDGHGGAKAGTMRWGLVPHWSKDAKTAFSTINARVETVEQKPAFREAFQRRRCLVVADAYFEWTPIDAKKKQAWRIHPAQSKVMLMAGLWERWIGPDASPLLSFSIVTEPAIGAMRELHERRPVALAALDLATWLRGSAQQAMAMLRERTAPEMAWHAVASPK